MTEAENRIGEVIDDRSRDALLGGYYVFYRRIIFLLILGGEFMLLLSLFDNLAAASILTGFSAGPLFILEDRWVRWRVQK